MPEHRNYIALTLAEPDQVRRSKRFADARLFSRFAADVKGGRHIVVVVVSDTGARRHWIITAYMTRVLVRGDIEWQRS